MWSLWQIAYHKRAPYFLVLEHFSTFQLSWAVEKKFLYSFRLNSPTTMPWIYKSAEFLLLLKRAQAHETILSKRPMKNALQHWNLTTLRTYDTKSRFQHLTDIKSRQYMTNHILYHYKITNNSTLVLSHGYTSLRWYDVGFLRWRTDDCL